MGGPCGAGRRPLDFEAGLPPTLLDYAASKPLVVLANKQDLLPKQTSAGEIAVWAARRLEELGVEAEVKVISALNGFGSGSGAVDRGAPPKAADRWCHQCRQIACHRASWECA